MTSLARTERPMPRYGGFIAERRSPARLPQPAWLITTAGVANGFVQGNLVILPGEAGGRVSPVLPAQSQTVPDHRHVRRRRSQDPCARYRSRHPHRPAALSRLARRRSGGGADRHPGAVARRSRRLRDRLLVIPSRRHCWRTDLPIRHIERNVRVPMYRTNIACGSKITNSGAPVVCRPAFGSADIRVPVPRASGRGAVRSQPVAFLIGIA